MTDKIFVITSNPDSSVVNTALDSNVGSVKTVLIVANSSHSSVRIAEESDRLAVVENPCEISKKVGKVI